VVRLIRKVSSENIDHVVDEEVDNTPLRIPVFNPSIPSHLIKDCNEQQKFVLERISVLIQQNKWQMEKLKDIEDVKHESDAKFKELYEFKTAVLIKEAKVDGSKLWKKYCFMLLALVAYPVYLAAADKFGITAIVKFFTL
jgi:hypothetical protein